MNEIEKLTATGTYLRKQNSLPNLKLELKKLIKPGRYNLLLYMHLGDDFQRIAIKDKFEKQYGEKIHFIIQPNEEFLMKMFGITEYTIFDLKKYVKKVITFSIDDIVVKEYYIQALIENSISPYPNRTEVFIISSYNEIQFDAWIEKNGIISNNYQYIQACLGIMNDSKIKLSRIAYPQKMGKTLQDKLLSIAPVEKIVLFMPEAKSDENINLKIWNHMAKAIISEGFTVIENITSSENHVSGAIHLDLSLYELLELAMLCHSVFSIRSGFCDILAAKEKNLYVLWLETRYKNSGEWFGFKNLYDFNNKSAPTDIVLSRQKSCKLFWRNKNILSGINKNWLPPTGFIKKMFCEYYKKQFLQAKNVLRKQLLQTFDFYSYLQLLINNKNKIVICFAVKDDASFFYTKRHEISFFDLGLQQSILKKYRKGYLAVIDQGVVMVEKIAKSQNEFVEGICKPSGLSIKIKSAGFNAGNYSSIRIDNCEYSRNNRGLNIVVFDVKARIIIDSVSVDLVCPSCPMYR